MTPRLTLALAGMSLASLFGVHSLVSHGAHAHRAVSSREAPSLAQDRHPMLGPTGKATVLFLFATWCKFSAYETRYVIPSFTTYLSKHHGLLAGVDETPLVGIARAGRLGRPDLGTDVMRRPHSRYDPVEFRRVVASYRRVFHLFIPVIADPRLTLESKLSLYFYGAYPTFVFVGRDGHVVTRAEGTQSLAALESTFSDVALYR